MSDDDQRVYRVTIRGRFHELSDEASRYLSAAQPEHDIFKSGYTSEGTFTYEPAIDFFNLRYEVRAGGHTPSETAHLVALDEAERFLRTMKFGYRDLKVDVVDMSAMWADVDRQRRR